MKGVKPLSIFINLSHMSFVLLAFFVNNMLHSYNQSSSKMLLEKS
jgi:hypothetical protein